MNGYFQLEVREKGVFMHFIPPTNGGKQCAIEDITAYLNFYNITGYNTIEISRMLERGTEGELFITGARLPVSGEEVFIEVSEDKMTAIAKFYPPFVGGPLLDVRGIKSTLEANNVTVGIKDMAVASFLANREYCTPCVIAEGIKPVHGEDARIEYFFNPELKARPQLNEDGSVDFHKLNGISHVNKGDVLAKLIPETKGTPGQDVLGNPVMPRDVKKKKLSYGKNIALSEDRLTITSEVDGHVSLVDGKVFVSDTYTVLADVDASTGDIEYNGNIEVKGCVRSGFVLKAEGNIMVNGVVEGATLIAEGDIILRCGIQGMGKGSLEAKGNVVTKFIENATVTAGGNITAEAILHSEVASKAEVLVTGKKGFITGGKVSALTLVEAKTIGSTMGAETVISVGTDPEDKARTQKCQLEMTRLNKEIVRLDPVVKKYTTVLKMGGKLPADKMIQAKHLLVQYQNYKKEYEEYETELFERLEKEEAEKDAKIRVKDKIYPGVKIVISDIMYMVKDVAQYCQFKKKGIDIKMSGL